MKEIPLTSLEKLKYLVREINSIDMIRKLSTSRFTYNNILSGDRSISRQLTSRINSLFKETFHESFRDNIAKHVRDKIRVEEKPKVKNYDNDETLVDLKAPIKHSFGSNRKSSCRTYHNN